MEAALQGQLALQGQRAETETLVEKVRKGGQRPKRSEGISGRSGILSIDTERIEIEEHREAGPVHVGHQIWQQLDLEEILGRAGLSKQARLLSEVMTLNRLIFPLSELSMPDWIRRTALGDILGIDFSELNEDSLYRNLDKLHPKREQVETELAEREKTLFKLEDMIYLYDLTSTYFEGLAEMNSQAKRGYSRDKRPDCKQVLVGLVLDRDGFPKAHEIFEGNQQDRSTVEEMLKILEKRRGKHPGATVVVDRGMAYKENLEQIRAHGLHYLVAGRQSERNEWLDDFEKEADWEEVIRVPSPRNPFQKKSRVEIKRRQKGDEVCILCLSEGREEKDRAIREKQQERLIKDLERLKRRIAKGHLKKTEKVHQAIGRLQERYPRVARYYEIQYQGQPQSLSWQEDTEKKAIAEKLDGSYVLRTDRQDLSADEIWRTYMLLTRVEAAFRSMKSPLMERPIFHHLKRRTQTHIFLCILAYHLLATIEKRFLDQGIHTSWWSIRQQLSTHQVATIVLPTSSGMVLRIRKGGIPEPEQKKIYEVLKIPSQVIKPIKTWQGVENSD
jgi:transposase